MENVWRTKRLGQLNDIAVFFCYKTFTGKLFGTTGRTKNIKLNAVKDEKNIKKIQSHFVML